MKRPVNEGAPSAQSVTCASCKASCCRLEVMLMPDDEVPSPYTKIDAWGGTVMARRRDGWCAALDRETMLCTIYERRPEICREFELGGYDCLEERRKAGVVGHSPALIPLLADTRPFSAC